MLNLKPHDIGYKKVVGHVKGTPVWKVVTTGGLNVIAMHKGAGIDVLSTGGHIAIAQYIAEQNEPDLVWTELSKSSDGIPSMVLKEISRPWIELTKVFKEEAAAMLWKK